MPLLLTMFKKPSVGSSCCGASQDLQESREVTMAAANHGGDSVSAGSRKDDEDSSVFPSASPSSAIRGVVVQTAELPSFAVEKEPLS